MSIIGWIVFNNPARHNAVSLEMWQAVAQIMEDFENDDQIRVVVLRPYNVRRDAGLPQYAPRAEGAPTEVFLRPDGAPHALGTRFRQPDLAGTLAAIAAEGPDAFYRGETAHRIVAEAHAHIRAELKELLSTESAGIRILYGGSVKPANAVELLAVNNVDGALVGGASLKAADFMGIIRAYA